MARDGQNRERKNRTNKRGNQSAGGTPPVEPSALRVGGAHAKTQGEPLASGATTAGRPGAEGPTDLRIAFNWVADDPAQQRLSDENEALRRIAADLQKQILSLDIDLRCAREEIRRLTVQRDWKVAS